MQFGWAPAGAVWLPVQFGWDGRLPGPGVVCPLWAAGRCCAGCSRGPGVVCPLLGVPAAAWGCWPLLGVAGRSGVLPGLLLIAVRGEGAMREVRGAHPLFGRVLVPRLLSVVWPGRLSGP